MYVIGAPVGTFAHHLEAHIERRCPCLPVPCRVAYIDDFGPILGARGYIFEECEESTPSSLTSQDVCWGWEFTWSSLGW